MEDALLEIVAALKAGERPDDAWLDRLVRRHNRSSHDAARTVAKRRLLPYYLGIRTHDPKRWQSWGVDQPTEAALLRLLKMKPRRTASGVATITVLTKPWPCSSDCLYCPNDVRCPKSYLADEPACQRAERNFFDPYLQVKARLHALSQMGHLTDKVELIVLGGTWSDYPKHYQRWFVRELFRALNDGLPYTGGPELRDLPHADQTVHPTPQADDSQAPAGKPGDRLPSCPANAPQTQEAEPDDTPLALSMDSFQAPASKPGGTPLACQTGTSPTQAGTPEDDSPAVQAKGNSAEWHNPLREAQGEHLLANRHDAAARTRFYAGCGLAFEAAALQQAAAPLQHQIDEGLLSYNQAIEGVLASPVWKRAAHMQQADWEEVELEHHANECARHRCVGLVIETRPDLITPDTARIMRRLGCTKIQMGIQSLDDVVLAANHRKTTSAQVAQAFATLRAYGFKTHVHFMVNLLGSTPEADKADYLRLVSDPRYCPDEVKLYPCALVASSRLMDAYQAGIWRPYTEEELLDVLVSDVLASPSYLRISRMIRDISSTDIVAGNKKTNLRQLVEARLDMRRGEVHEIRMREVAGASVTREELRLDTMSYQTATTEERFLQWVTATGQIAGFCRLSLPDPEAGMQLPTAPGTAMIREVHVYGRVAGLGTSEAGAAQHAGLGKALVEEACNQARAAGYHAIAVISAVGTRRYYRRLGFEDGGLYQRRSLTREELP